MEIKDMRQNVFDNITKELSDNTIDFGAALKNLQVVLLFEDTEDYVSLESEIYDLTLKMECLLKKMNPSVSDEIVSDFFLNILDTLIIKRNKEKESNNEN